MSGIAGPVDRHDAAAAAIPPPAQHDPITSSGNYIQRRIDLIFEIGRGKNGEDGTELITIRGLRVSAQIEKLSAIVGGSGACQVAVYGLPFELINALSSMGEQIPLVRKNKITVLAGDQNSVAEVFSGDIVEAWADFNAMPDVAMTISAMPGLLAAVKPVDALSVDGTVDAVLLMRQLADRMGYQFENSGVPATMLDHPYYPGTAMDQAGAIAVAAHINWTIDHDTLAIWPINGFRPGGDIPLISRETGMIGYPSYARNGIKVRSAFNPAIKFGGKMKIDCEIHGATGEWIIFMMSHDLMSEAPDGPWFTDLEGYRLGQVSAGIPSR
jgi:hypothetical protein